LISKNIFPSLNEQLDVIRRGTVEILPEEELISKIENSLKNGQPLNIKLGCDPTKPDLHLGHSVVLRKLAEFQQLGHQAILIIGDFTAMIGDPTGKNTTRPPLSFEETREYAKTYIEQATKILSKKKTKIVYNSQWLAPMNFADVIKLTSKYTVARMLERDDFTKRMNDNRPISMHEILYPLAQAQDSVAIQSDIELGGTDQKFNLLVGRDIQRENDISPQVIITLPLLLGTDGVNKMSKSLDNYIGIDESPNDIFGKTMSIPDELIFPYFELASEIPATDLPAIKEKLSDPTINPKSLKVELAKILVKMYHSKEKAEEAEKYFDSVISNKEKPEDIPEILLPSDKELFSVADLLMLSGSVSSLSEARRLCQGGAVYLDDIKHLDFKITFSDLNGKILKSGKRKYYKLIHIK